MEHQVRFNLLQFIVKNYKGDPVLREYLVHEETCSPDRCQQNTVNIL